MNEMNMKKGALGVSEEDVARFPLNERISKTEEIVNEAREGRMFILVDDENRENEGDLIIPAQMVTPAAINFMATFGRGLICLALTSERVLALGLHPMTTRNTERLGTAFTNSIEAKEGVTTGISAADRARTVSAAIDTSNGPEALVSPGHIFPLEARNGGVLVRAGHTEASVDVARLAGLNPSAVICEVMNEDGTMARLSDLLEFGKRHDLKIGTIQDLIAFRRRHDHLIDVVSESVLDSRHGGEWTARIYRNRIDGIEHMALIKEPLDKSQPVAVRVHAVSSHFDFLGQTEGRTELLQRAMRIIARLAGGGVVVLLSNPSSTALSEDANGKLQAQTKFFRTYGIGAQILADLSVDRVKLLTNSNRTPISLAGFGIDIVDRLPIVSAAEERD